MSTAVARIWTPSGFVIAADGRSANERNQVVLSDSVQKIFAVERPDGALAYAICGLAGLNDIEGNPVLDLVSAVASIVEQLRAVASKSLWHYGEEIRSRLHSRIIAAKESRNGLPPEFPASEAETYLFFSGYYAGKPKAIRIRFFHHGIAQRETDSETVGEMPMDLRDYGSAQVFGMLQAEHVSFADFRPSRKYEGMSLESATKIAINLVSAHGSETARAIDPSCWAMGGRVHAATITFEGGFQWIPGFRPLSE